MVGLGAAATILAIPNDASSMDMYNGFRGPILGPNANEYQARITQQIKMRKNMADKVAEYNHDKNMP